MALQHLRSSTANKRPLPAVMADGQLATNTNTASPGLFVKDSGGNLVKLGPVHVGTTAPNTSPAAGGATGNSTGELWLDTSLTPNQLKTWNGSAWVSDFPDEIPVAKLADGAARQLLQTDAAGTGVEWTSNVDVPGTLDVTGATTLDSTLTVPLGSAAAPTLRFTGDTNTGIYSPGADQVAISANGAGRLFINADGTIDFGTTSGSATPTVKASSNPVLTFSNGTNSSYVGLVGTDNRLINFSTNGTTLIQSDSAINLNVVGSSNFTVGTLGTERLRIDSSGRLGLGTSSPSALLHLDQGGTSSGTQGPEIRLSRASLSGASLTAGDVLNTIKFQTNATTRYYSLEQRSGSLTTNSTFHLAFEGDGTKQTYLTVDSGGKVGIGTTSPSEKLAVTDSSASPAIIVGRTPFSSHGNLLIHGSSNTITSQTDSDGNSTVNVGASRITISNGNISFSRSGSTAAGSARTFTESARIDSSGRLLVGTSTARNNVFNTTVSGGQVQIETAGAGGGEAQFGIYGGASGSAFPGPVFILGAHKSASVGGNGLLSSGDRVGLITFQGNDGTKFAEAARIVAEVDGTPGADDMPGRLVFSTTADGASSPTERMRIKNDGTINFSNVATYADNAAATAGGLVVGDVYRTSTGQLMIRY